MFMKLKGDFFDGQWHSPSTPPNETLKKQSPADLSVTLWEAHVWHSHTDAVVESAVKGFESWRKLSFEERSVYIRRYQEAVKKRGDQIAERLAWEVGKPLWEAKTEAAALVSKVDVTLGDSWKRIETMNLQT